MVGNAKTPERNTGTLVIWGIGFFLIFLLLGGAAYMYITREIAKRKKKKEDSENGNVGQMPVVYMDFETTQVSEVVEPSAEDLEGVEAAGGQSMRESTVEENNMVQTAISVSQSKEEVLEGPSAEKTAVTPIKNGTAEKIESVASKESASKEYMVPPEKEVGKKPEVKNSVETVEKVEKVEKNEKIEKPIINQKESLSSEGSGYQMSSKRSQVNNFNMLEAGRTPPTESQTRIRMIEMDKSTLTAIPSPVPISVANEPARSSETAVSMTTPPLNRKKK